MNTHTHRHRHADTQAKSQEDQHQNDARKKRMIMAEKKCVAADDGNSQSGTVAASTKEKFTLCSV